MEGRFGIAATAVRRSATTAVPRKNMSARRSNLATYDLKCQSSQCEQTFEVRLPMDDRDSACIRCPACNSEARRQVVPFKAPACIMMKPLNQGGQTPERMLP